MGRWRSVFTFSSLRFKRLPKASFPILCFLIINKTKPSLYCTSVLNKSHGTFIKGGNLIKKITSSPSVLHIPNNSYSISEDENHLQRNK